MMAAQRSYIGTYHLIRGWHGGKLKKGSTGSSWPDGTDLEIDVQIEQHMA